MLFSFAQSARAGLPGPSFFDLLRSFRDEPLAALYSGGSAGHSVIARKPRFTVTAADEHSRIFTYSDDRLLQGLESHAPLLDAWEAFIEFVDVIKPIHPLTSWIGHFTYDFTRTLEPLPTHAVNDHSPPILLWKLFDEYYLFYHAALTWTIVATHWHDSSDIQQRLDAMSKTLEQCPTPAVSNDFATSLIDSLPRDTFLQSIERIKNYIAAGDIFQANFAQRWKYRTNAHPVDLFERLMHFSPSQYAALLIDYRGGNNERWAAVSGSPELLLQREGDRLLTRPIKGTRPRDLRDPLHDEALRSELQHSAKDQAELAMIVDVLRNDLGRVARFGSVRVAIPREIEALPTLWHAHSVIEAACTIPDRAQETQSRMKPLSFLKVSNAWSTILRALFPGGSVTGAPKIRATQIIEELEPFRRGIYCGSIGAVSRTADDEFPWAGTFNLAIRTIQMVGDSATIHAGAGIVADSDPQAEYEETLHKAHAMFRALNAAPPNSCG